MAAVRMRDKASALMGTAAWRREPRGRPPFDTTDLFAICSNSPQIDTYSNN